MIHEQSGVGLNPAFFVKAEASASDNQMDVSMITDMSCGAQHNLHLE